MTAAAARVRPGVASSSWVGSAAVPVALGPVALLLGLAAAALVEFPHNEGSAYYVGVARNLAAGRGLVVDAIWSYATPPLVLPRPAFELWQPLASLIAAIPMALLGGSFAAAQLAGVVLGAALAPLAWLITREAGDVLGIDARRADVLAIGSGLLTAVLAPLLLARAVPESTLPFAVFGGLACWLVPRAIHGRTAAGVALGGALGLAYLARHEAIWLALVFVLLALAAKQLSVRRLAPVVVGGLFVVGPWLARNVAVFGKPFPGQALDNALLTSTEQIFAYREQPTLDGFLAQGFPQIVHNIVAGAAHNLVDVLLVPALPVGLVGLVGAAVLLRRPAVRSSALGALLLSGLLIFAATSVLFPVATQSGTFQHAAGPLLVGLSVAAVLIADRSVGFVGRLRGWSRPNSWLAPLALVTLAAVLALLQVAIVAAQSDATRQRITALATAVAAQPEVIAGERPLLVSDRAIWLSDATGLPALVLPREPAAVVLQAIDELTEGPALLVLTDQRLDPRRGGGAAADCFVPRPLPPAAPLDAAILLALPGCGR